jgi:hypothetical protein
MPSTSSLSTDLTAAFPACIATSSDLPAAGAAVDRLGDAIAELAARLHAATYELLVLLRHFDDANGWNNGFLSCAHWFSWRTGIDPGAAREKVRVARALATLPLISAAMARGELSYSKVRALTRIATAAQEPMLLDIAHAGTASHVERIVRAWRRVDRLEAARLTELRQQHRQLTTWVDEDGMLVIRGRLTPEAGAVVQRALEAATDPLFRESASAAASGVHDEVTPAQRRADALCLVAERALAADQDRDTTSDRYQVIVHVDVATLQSEEGATDPGQAVVEVGDGATYVSAETAQRIACDASLVVMHHGPDGSVLDVGRRRRSPPAAIRRALAARDGRCQFPGCTARRCDAHHLQPWALGGRTSLEGLVLLCRRHHTAVHEGRFRIERARDGTVTVWRPDGMRIETAPRPPDWVERDPSALGPTQERMARVGRTVGALTTAQAWRGERIDIGWAIDVLRAIDGGPAQTTG